MKIDLTQIKDDRTMLLESFVCARKTYIDMLSLRELGDICPDIAHAIENVKSITGALHMYLGDAAINEYNVQQRERRIAEGRAYHERRKQAVIAFQAKRSQSGKKGGASCKQ